MVDYSCSICKKNYGNSIEGLTRAKVCESGGLIGPDLKPGVLFSHNKVDDGFLIFYNELPSEGHDRIYHFEEIIVEDHLMYGLQKFKLGSSEFKKWFNDYNIAKNEEVDEFNKKIENNFKGSGAIKVYLERFKIEKLHNNLDLEAFLTSFS